MQNFYGKAKHLCKQYEDIFWVLAYEGIMIYAAYYAVIVRYLYYDYIYSKKLAILSILCGVLSIITIVRFDYRHVFKGEKNHEK